jgi:signal transduction histidine kinase
MNNRALLSLQGGNDDIRAEIIADMKETHARMESLINNVVNLANLTDSSIEAHKEKAHIDRIIAREIKRSKNALEDRKINVNVSNKLGNRKIMIDVKLFGIALNCLINNAIKFNKPGGRVTIDVKSIATEGTESLAVSIEDTGIGIKEEEQKNLFKSFVQAEDHMTRQFQGIGIGLFLVKRTMDILRGEISVTSAEGKGSTFILSIPVIEDINGNNGQKGK